MQGKGLTMNCFAEKKFSKNGILLSFENPKVDVFLVLICYFFKY